MKLEPKTAVPQIEGTQEQTHERTFPPSKDAQSSGRPAARTAAITGETPRTNELNFKCAAEGDEHLRGHYINMRALSRQLERELNAFSEYGKAARIWLGAKGWKDAEGYSDAVAIKRLLLDVAASQSVKAAERELAELQKQLADSKAECDEWKRQMGLTEREIIAAWQAKQMGGDLGG